MKKLVALFLMLALTLGVSAMAEDLGVQVIGENKTDVVATLDDLQSGVVVEIPGYAEVTVTKYAVQDCIMVRKPGVLGYICRLNGSSSSQYIEAYGKNFSFTTKVECTLHSSNKEYPYICTEWVGHYESKSQAEYALLYIDVLNTTSMPVNFIENCQVKVIYDDTAEFAGWVRQRNEDLNQCDWIDAKDNFAVDPYYIGHYVFGCTLPNTVIERDAPMRMEITIGDIEMTYHIRK